jgi:hypothetical protein
MGPGLGSGVLNRAVGVGPRVGCDDGAYVGTLPTRAPVT